jgi:type IV pilus assembly protein PilC
VISYSLKRIREAIIRGEKLSEAFKNEKVFLKRISMWISVGEASGNIGSVFSQLRMYFQGELDKITSRIMLLIEPLLIVFVGVFMILFVILFVVPIFSLFGAVI